MIMDGGWDAARMWTSVPAAAFPHDNPALEHVPKKLLDFFDKDMLQLFEFERFLFDHVIPVIGKRPNETTITFSMTASCGEWRRLDAVCAFGYGASSGAALLQPD